MTRHVGTRGDDGRYGTEEPYAAHMLAALAAGAGAVVLARVAYVKGRDAWEAARRRRWPEPDPTVADLPHPEGP